MSYGDSKAEREDVRLIQRRMAQERLRAVLEGQVFRPEWPEIRAMARNILELEAENAELRRDRDQLVDALSELLGAVKTVPEMNNQRFDAIGVKVLNALMQTEQYQHLTKVDTDGGATCDCGFGFSFKFWIQLRIFGHVECSSCRRIFTPEVAPKKEQ